MSNSKEAPRTLGQRIKQRRLALGLTQQELAEVLGFTPQHISAIEQDQRVPSLASLVKLAEHLGVTVDYLATGKEGPKVDAMSVLPAIKADKRLSPKVKKALVSLIEELYKLKE